MVKFSVAILTAPPMGIEGEGNGAFVKIDGRECLLRSIELFLNRETIGQVQLVVAREQIEESKRKYGGHLAFSGVKLVEGGPGWMDQIIAANAKVAGECTHVILHDAARPAVAFGDIDALLDAAPQNPILALSAPARSDLAEVDAAGKPVAFHPAASFVQLLTPWVFAKSKFAEVAQSRAMPGANEVTLVRGSSLNVRVNSSADAHFAKTMIAMLPKPKIRAADNPFDEAQW